MNIFNISRELEDIFFQIEENGGEITPELEERFYELKPSEDLQIVAALEVLGVNITPSEAVDSSDSQTDSSN